MLTSKLKWVRVGLSSTKHTIYSRILYQGYFFFDVHLCLIADPAIETNPGSGFQPNQFPYCSGTENTFFWHYKSHHHTLLTHSI